MFSVRTARLLLSALRRQMAKYYLQVLIYPNSLVTVQALVTILQCTSTISSFQTTNSNISIRNS
jgi:hypothetical protein